MLPHDYIRPSQSMVSIPVARPRCPWASGEPLAIAYHDTEWGVPVHDDRIFFEFLILEGAQAGLSWNTILRKRSRYREAFSDFDPKRVARYDRSKIESLLLDPGIVRNRSKVEGAVRNARAFLRISEEFGTFNAYIWRFVGGQPVQNRWKALQQVPASTQISERMSKELKQRDFTFVGPSICYAFMQAVGLVNDHLVSCFRHEELA